LLKSKRLWIGLLITTVTLYIAFQGIQFDQLANALGRINYLYLPVGIVVFWLSYGGRVYRWQLLFYPYHLRWNKVLSTLSIGYFLSNITPLRVGDLVRAYLIATIEKVPIPRALSAVVVERTADGLTIVLFLIILLPIIPNLPGQARSAGAVLGVLGLGLLVALALLSLQRTRGIGFLKRVTARVKFLQREALWHALDNLIDGFAVLHAARPILGVALWSISIWFFGAVLNWVVMQAMDIPLGLDAALVIIVVTSLAVTAAPTPGQFGVYHLAAQFALTTVYGLDKSVALAYAFVIHAFVYLSLMVLGTFFMWREGFSYGKLQAVESSAQ
jgi:uncharacterized protein (TIRG00374 family)